MIVLLPHEATGYAFQAIHQRRHRHLWRIVHQQVHMILLAVELHQLRLEVAANLGEDAAQVVENGFGEHATPIFCHKDQMDVHLEYAVPAVSNILVIVHRPNYTLEMKRQKAYKYELQPNGDQQRQMRRFAGSCRFVFNKALALQKQRDEQGEKKLGYAGLFKRVTATGTRGEGAW